MKSGWHPKLQPFLHDILCVLAEPKLNGLWVNDYTWTYDEDDEEGAGRSEAVATWKRYDDTTWGVDACMKGDFCHVRILRNLAALGWGEPTVVMTFLIAPQDFREVGVEPRKCVVNKLMDVVLKEA